MKPATPEQTARFFKGTKKHPLFYATIPVVSAGQAPQPEPEQIPSSPAPVAIENATYNPAV